ncbi:MAG: putative selenium-dependent hydroxylase accessory protein YqeC, partial [Deltaproteobacteria bacterium]|nr:putative selenium-dependent hydroxylase accessory protein YqeC [Deltaproteobacteria bacterium]
MNLSHALRLTPHDVVAFVGAGGKTTTMFRLANEIVQTGGRVITTTTTRLGLDQLSLAPVHVQLHPLPEGSEPSGSFDELHRALEKSKHVLFTGEIDHVEEKVRGVSLKDFGSLRDFRSLVLIEADGSKQLPFKAPAEHEPVIPDFATQVVVVVGVDALGKPLTNEYVHRPEIVARLAQTRVGTIINSEIIAKVLTHPDGGFKNVPPSARVSVLINKVESDEQLKAAREIADQTLRVLRSTPQRSGVGE